MCKVLKIARSSFYYQGVIKDEIGLENKVKQVFDESKKTYGTRRIKLALYEQYRMIVSRRKIGEIMAKLQLVSKYTEKIFKPHKYPSNKSTNINMLQQDFAVALPHITIVSDLTYVRVGGKWNYICLMIDLYNGAIVGSSCHHKKDTTIVSKAFASIDFPLGEIEIFHTDRGNEFTGNKIQSTLSAFDIKHSLSRGGTPLDNAVAESTMSILKLEFVEGEFSTLEELKMKLDDYINWYNYHRIHSRNGFKPPLAS